jgi:hypothetical protein
MSDQEEGTATGKFIKKSVESLQPPKEREVLFRHVIDDLGIEIAFEPSYKRTPYEFLVTQDGKLGTPIARFDELIKANMFLDAFIKGYDIGKGNVELPKQTL